MLRSDFVMVQYSVDPNDYEIETVPDFCRYLLTGKYVGLRTITITIAEEPSSEMDVLDPAEVTATSNDWQGEEIVDPVVTWEFMDGSKSLELRQSCLNDDYWDNPLDTNNLNVAACYCKLG